MTFVCDVKTGHPPRWSAVYPGRMRNPLANEALEVTVQDAAQALADGSAVVVDVREQYEWDAGRIAGTVHIPLERLAE